MIETLINQGLQLDPNISQLMTPLRHKTIAIHKTDEPQRSWYLRFDDDYLMLLDNKPEQVDITISATTIDFIDYVLTRKQPHIDGKLADLEALAKFVANLDLDWEEFLATHSNDIIAYNTMQLLRAAKAHVTHSSKSLTNSLSLYLERELGIIPSNYELQEYMHAVDELRLQVDRLAAKVELYADC